MIRFQTFFFLALGFTTYGCATVGVTQLKPDIVRKAHNCPLEIFTAEKDISKPFEVVCLLDSRTGTSAFADKTAAGAINEARPKACECGADGMLIQHTDTEGMTLATWGQGKAIIKAIRFTSK